MKKSIKKMLLVLIKVFYIFPIDKNKIFFMNFNGTSYGFDSKAVVEYINSNQHGQWKMIWGIEVDKRQFDSISIDDLKFVKIQSLKGIFHLMTAGSIFYNINAPSFIPYRKAQLRINTWHSISYKKIGKYTNIFDEKQVNLTTHYLSHAKKFSEWVLRDSLEYTNEIIPCGVPRNDIFFTDKQFEVAMQVREKLSIPKDKKIVLFAPTFRGSTDFVESGLDYNRLKNALNNRFGEEWFVLFRLHPMIANLYNVNYEDVMNVSNYPDMQELLCLADFFISDYSGGMWDFALKRKPVFIFATDIEKYNNSRGLYMEPSELPFPIAKNNDEMEEAIINFNETQYLESLEKYFAYMGCYEKGKASETTMELLHQHHGI